MFYNIFHLVYHTAPKSIFRSDTYRHDTLRHIFYMQFIMSKRLVFSYWRIYRKMLQNNFYSDHSENMNCINSTYLLFIKDENLNRNTLAGIAITILTISIIFQSYSILSSKICHLIAYLGKNSLSIVIFSPIFTVRMKNSSFFLVSIQTIFALRYPPRPLQCFYLYSLHGSLTEQI